MENKEVKRPKSALAEYRKNETPAQREERIAKAVATRKENKEKERAITKQVNRLLKSKWKYLDQDGNVKYGNGAAVIASTMMQDAITVGGRNTTAAQKQILQLAGELEEEKLSNNIMVVFSNKEQIDV